MKVLVPVLAIAACVLLASLLIRKFAKQPFAEVGTAIAQVPDLLVRFVADAIGGIVALANRLAATGLQNTLGGGWALARFLGALVAAALWVAAFNLVRSLDFETLVAMGHTPLVAAQLTTLLVAFGTATGLVLSEVIGLTKVLPLHEASRKVRLVVGGVALVAFGCTAYAQWLIGTERGAQYAHVKLVAARESGRLETEPGLADRLAREAEMSKLLDGATAVAGAVLEAATSWGILVAALVIVVAGLWLLTVPLRLLRFLLSALSLVLNRLWQVYMSWIGANVETVTGPNRPPPPAPAPGDGGAGSGTGGPRAEPPHRPRRPGPAASAAPRPDEAGRGQRTTPGADPRWSGA